MGKQIISSDSIQIKEALGEGEFGKVLQGTWTTESGEKVSKADFSYCNDDIYIVAKDSNYTDQGGVGRRGVCKVLQGTRVGRK